MKQKLIFQLSVLLVLCTCFSVAIPPYECRIEINTIGKAYSSCTYEIKQNNSLYIPIESHAESLDYLSRKRLTHFTERNGDIIANATADDFIEVKYYTDSFTKKSGKKWFFDLIIGKADDVKIVLLLPEETEYIAENSTIPDNSFVENYRKVLVWNRWTENIYVEYYFPEKKSDIFSRLGNYGFIFLFLIVSITVGYFLGKKNIVTKRPIDAVLKTLDGDEKLIVQELIKLDGELLQSTIQSNLKMNKYHISREIEKLCKKHIVVKERVGKANKIRLSKWLMS